MLVRRNFLEDRHAHSISYRAFDIHRHPPHRVYIRTPDNHRPTRPRRKSSAGGATARPPRARARTPTEALCDLANALVAALAEDDAPPPSAELPPDAPAAAAAAAASTDSDVPPGLPIIVWHDAWRACTGALDRTRNRSGLGAQSFRLSSPPGTSRALAVSRSAISTSTSPAAATRRARARTTCATAPPTRRSARRATSVSRPRRGASGSTRPTLKPRSSSRFKVGRVVFSCDVSQRRATTRSEL